MWTAALGIFRCMAVATASGFSNARHLRVEPLPLSQPSMAPAFTPEAFAVFKSKVNVRILEIALPAGGDTAWAQGRNLVDVKRVGSGLLSPTAHNHHIHVPDLNGVTQPQTNHEH